MDTVVAWSLGEANRGKPLMIFDWHKAAELIKECSPKEVHAGLRGDWEWTGGAIYKDGKPVPQEDTYVYLASTWATPEIELDGQVFDCFVMEGESSNGWGSDTYWPDSALLILNRH